VRVGADHNKDWLRLPYDSTFLRSHYLDSHPYVSRVAGEVVLIVHPTGFVGAGDEPAGWALDKLGSWVQASDVVPRGGAAHLHAVGDGGARRACGSQVGGRQTDTTTACTVHSPSPRPCAFCPAGSGVDCATASLPEVRRRRPAEILMIP
jgi:hypothetical protein